MTSVGDTIASAVLVVEMEKEQLEEGERKEEVEREGPSVLGSLLYSHACLLRCFH